MIANNRTWQKIFSANCGLADEIRKQDGFIKLEQLPELIKVDRLMLLLVRCNNGRFLTPAQDVEHFCNIIEEHCKIACAIERQELPKNGDWVRDISLPE